MLTFLTTAPDHQTNNKFFSRSLTKSCWSMWRSQKSSRIHSPLLLQLRWIPLHHISGNNLEFDLHKWTRLVVKLATPINHPTFLTKIS